jgi:class 3 adenylate cyclase
VAEARHSAYIVIDGPGHESTRLPLREGITSFGRLPANDVILLGDLVSRHHSRITFFEGRATLQDLGSHNGSWINGERTTSRVLEDGDTIRVGNFRIVFHHGPIPAPLDETTAGADASGEVPAPRLSSTDGPEGAAALLGEIEAARAGQPSPARAVHFLYRTTDALARAGDAVGYAHLLLELALEHIPADAAAWLQLEHRALEIRAARDDEGPVDRVDIHVPAVQWSIDRSLAVRSDDLGADPRFGPGPSGVAVLSAPLLEGPARGALYLQRSTPFEPVDLHRLGVIAHVMQNGLHTLAQRGGTADLATRLVGPEARERIVLAAPGRPEVTGSSRSVAVLLDLHGLAPLIERLEPRAAFGFAARFQELADARARDAGGLAIPLNGHRALVILTSEPSSATDALALAVALRSDVDSLLEADPSLGPRRLRAGVACGPVALGAYTGERAGIAAFGPATSAARRLVDAAGAGRILVDAMALELAGPGWEARKVGAQPIRGARQARPVFELVGPAPEPR